jgi:hypothetical protein
MSDEPAETKADQATEALLILLTLALVPLSVAAGAWSTMTVWNTFVLPVYEHLPVLGFWQTLAILIIVGRLREKPRKSPDPLTPVQLRELGQRVRSSCLTGLVIALVVKLCVWMSL